MTNGISSEAVRSALVEIRPRAQDTIQQLPLAMLKANPVQPPWRVKATTCTMRRLCESIKHRGLLNPICVARIGKEYVVIDGHRRRQAHELIGLTHIKCRLAEVANIAEAESLFAEIDQGTMKQGGRDRLYGWATATDRDAYLDTLTKSQSGIIRQFVKIFGESDAVHYAKAGTNPSIAQSTVQLIRFLNAHLGSEEVLPTKKRAGQWIIEWHAVDIVNALVRTGGRRDANRALKAILQNEAMTFKNRKTRNPKKGK